MLLHKASNSFINAWNPEKINLNNIVFQYFNTTDMCDPLNIWRLNALNNADTLEVSLMQAGSRTIELQSLTIKDLKTNGLFWFLDNQYQVAKWLIYLYGGKYFQSTSKLNFEYS